MEISPLIAHRGASAYAPENTMAAFDKAFAMGAQMVEFDVLLSQDGIPFVIHDENLRRTTSGRGLINEKEADYLRSLDAGKWFSRKFKGERIPELSEVLKWCKLSGVRANIELKPCKGTEETTAFRVMEVVLRHCVDQELLPLISSFDWKVLHLCRSVAPEQPLGLLMHEWKDNWLSEARALDVFSVHVNRKILSRERVAQIKEEGYRLAVYTVNRVRQANKLFRWGVDAIFSDYPDLLS